MPRRSIGLLLIISTIVLFMGVAVATVGAQGSSQPSRQYTYVKVGNRIFNCKNLDIRLHGSLPATYTCVDGTPSSSEKYARSNIAADSVCPSSGSLDLWWNANQGDPHICISGPGYANMTDFSACDANGCTSWNDQVSSYYTGCSGVTFYVDTNKRGRHASVGTFRSGNFPVGAVPNDALSSVAFEAGC